jgi:hypothetical protein
MLGPLFPYQGLDGGGGLDSPRKPFSEKRDAGLRRAGNAKTSNMP